MENSWVEEMIRVDLAEYHASGAEAANERGGEAACIS